MAFGDELRAKLQNIGAKLRDDEGLFQGGKFGRIGGRFKDWADSTRVTMGDNTVAGETLSGLTGAAPGKDITGYVTAPTGKLATIHPKWSQPRDNVGFADARALAATFDPSNPNQVRELQLRLIDQGYLPEGSADAMFGPQTEAALREMQGHFDINDPGNPQNLLDYAMHQKALGNAPTLDPEPTPEPNAPSTPTMYNPIFQRPSWMRTD